MSVQSRSIPIAAMLAATAAWGSLFHVGKWVLGQIDPYWFTGIRYVLATLLLFAVLHQSGVIRWCLMRRHWQRLTLYGVLGYGFFSLLVFIGLSLSVPSHGAVIMATMPITTLFVRWLLDGQPPKWWAWCVAAFAIVGVALVSGLFESADARAGVSTWHGDLMAFVGTFGWVLYTRGQGRTAGLSVIEYTAFAALLSLPVLVAFVAFATVVGLAHVPNGHSAIAILPSLIYIVTIPTVFGALAFNYGVRQLGATNGIVFINFVPVSALLIGCALGHWPSPTETTGAVLVVSALLFQARWMSTAR